MTTRRHLSHTAQYTDDPCGIPGLFWRLSVIDDVVRLPLDGTV
jgi:hypothetical protein